MSKKRLLSILGELDKETSRVIPQHVVIGKGDGLTEEEMEMLDDILEEFWDAQDELQEKINIIKDDDD